MDLRLHFVDLDGDVVDHLSRAFAGIDEVTCATGDILAVATHALVSPANSYGFMDGGIDAAYSAFFGPQLQVTVQEAINRRPEGLLPVGASLAVQTGHARIPFLIVAPTMHTPEEVPSEHCYRAMRAVLRLIDATGLTGDVFCPGLATGTGRVPAGEAAQQMLRAYEDWRNLQAPRSFERVCGVWQGERVPLDSGSSKVLFFMLGHAEGCDASMTPAGFEVQFGRQPPLSRYLPWIAPGVLSQLLEWAGIHGPSDRLQVRIGPGLVPPVEFPAWSYGTRHLWIQATEESLSIQVRAPDAASDPDVLPSSFAYQPVFVDTPARLSCPHCQKAADRFRRLSSGELVCPSCGGSFIAGGPG